MLARWLSLAVLGSMAIAGQAAERPPLAPGAPGRNRWESRGPSRSSVTRVIPDFSSDEVVYCVAQGRVFRTLNSGSRWFPLDFGSVLIAGVAGIAIDPSDSDVLLAVPLGVPSVVFKSTDAGYTWSPRNLSAPASTSSPEPVLWDKGRPNRVFFLTFQGVIRSQDAGETWDLLTPGVPGGSLTALALDSSSGALYAANPAGIFRLDLDAAGWTQLSGPLLGPVGELDVDPARPNILYAITRGGFPRLFRSLDGGRSWEGPDLTLGSPGVTVLAVDPLHPDVLYGVGGFGIVRSEDGGFTWIDYSAGLNVAGAGYVQTIALGPTGTLFAGLSGGAFRRATGETAWTPIDDGLPGLPMVRIAADASPRGPIYAAAAASVWLSEDAGLTWDLSLPFDSYQSSTALTADASTPGTAYLGVYGLCSPPPYSGCVGGIFKTTDRGQHWQVLQTPNKLGGVQAVAVDPTRPGILFAAGYSIANVGFRSLDGGVSWDPLTNGFPTDGVSRILVDLRVPDSIYVGTSHGVVKSADGGASWSATGLGNASVTSLAQDARGGILYAGSDVGLFSSEDSGASWTLRGFPGGVLGLAIDPRSGAVYAATANAGVQGSSDGGRTWSALASGLQGMSVSDLAFSPDGSVLYAATQGGVYVFRFRGLRVIQSR